MSDNLIFWLANELNERGWSQRELARRADIAPTTVSEVLAERRKPTFDFCAAIAGPLGKTPVDVFRLAGLLPSPPEVVNEPRAGYDESTEVQKVVDILGRLPADKRQEILHYAEFTERRYLEELAEALTPTQRAAAARVGAVLSNTRKYRTGKERQGSG